MKRPYDVGSMDQQLLHHMAVRNAEHQAEHNELDFSKILTNDSLSTGEFTKG